MTDRASFDRAIRWLTELPSTMPADTVLVLVGALTSVLLICHCGSQPYGEIRDCDIALKAYTDAPQTHARLSAWSDALMLCS